jgi:hypothetical protein
MFGVPDVALLPPQLHLGYAAARRLVLCFGRNRNRARVALFLLLAGRSSRERTSCRPAKTTGSAPPPPTPTDADATDGCTDIVLREVSVTLNASSRL